jgi:hypothetical protein
LRLGACAALASVWIGCASPVTVILTHDGRSSLSGGAGRRLVLAAPFDDARPLGGTCGVQSGAFGLDGPAILCDREPAPFLASAFAAELERAGFTVERVDRAPATPDAPVIRGVLERLYLQTTGGFSHFVMEADLHVRLEVDAPGGLRARRSFFAKGNRGVGGTAGAAAQASANDAVDRIVRNMTAAVLSLTNQYPELAVSAEARP